MAKYRILTADELKNFEKEFIDYLVVNGIVADDWVKLKEEDKEKAEKIIDLFSDVIFEGVLRKVKFLEIRTKSYVQAVQCLEDKMIMVALSTKDAEADLTQIDWENPGNTNFDLHKGDKSYSDTREAELFAMTEKGYQISDGRLFKQLLLATVE